MKRALKATGWFFVAIDATAMLFVLQWALTASPRDGENAYALIVLILAVAYLGVGGGAHQLSSQRGSLVGLWLSTLFLGIPPVIIAAIRISNSL
jgi:hypothetical protein